MAQQEMTAAIAALGLTMTVQFVPWSQSRNKGEDRRSLNWKVTLLRNGREILTTDYMAGIAHCPSYKQSDRSVMRSELVEWECEHGKRAVEGSIGIWGRGPALEPKIEDVVWSLVSEADVLEYPTFESWASEYGYDADSRKAEKIYRACLETALKLRAALGDDGLRQLREAAQDY